MINEAHYEGHIIMLRNYSTEREIFSGVCNLIMLCNCFPFLMLVQVPEKSM